MEQISLKRVKTYVEGLDERLQGGIPSGFIILVCGPTGSLKSTFVYRILYKEAREKGSSALFLSMEQGKESLLAQMSALGMDLAKAETLHVVDMKGLRRDISSSSKRPDWLTGLRKQLSRYKEEIGCDLLAIDSLNALYALTNFENPRNELFHFFEDLRDIKATVFLISEMPRDAVRFGGYDVEEFLADGIVHLRMKESDVGLATTVRRYIGVVKLRGVDHDLDYFPLLVEKGQFEIVAE